MRKLVAVAATLACASAGVLAAARPSAGDQAARPQTKSESAPQPGPNVKSKTKTVIVEHRDGDDEQGDVMRLQLPFSSSGVRIGVTVANLDDEQAKSLSGVVVTSVREDSPAAKAGVKEKDVITEFDGEKVRSARQLTRLVGETPPGRTVKLAAVRDGKRVDLQVTPEQTDLADLGELGRGFDPFTPDRMPRLHPGMPLGPEGERRFHFEGPEGSGRWEWREPEGQRFFFRNPGERGGDTFGLFAAPGRGRLGIGIQDLSDQLAEYFGTKDGVLVSSVTADSPAAKAGLRAGDVVTTVNDIAVKSAEELIDQVRKVGDGGSVKIGYVRDKRPATVTATLEKRESRPKRQTQPI